MMPTSAVFDKVFEFCKKVSGDRTTDYVDENMAGKTFPFVYVGESFDNPLNMRARVGTVTQTVHIYATRKQRRWAEDWLSLITEGLRRGFTDNIYHLYNTRVNYQVLDMVEGKQQLLHYVIEYEVDYNLK